MAKFFDALTEEHIKFIGDQKVFFTGSYSGQNGVNVSPKGIVPLKILDKSRVAYLDFFGSGNRTSEDIIGGSMVTLMFCSFDAKPLILRLFCRGETLKSGEERFDEMLAMWDKAFSKRARNIFVFHINKVQTSCGYGVPVFSHLGNKNEALKLTDLPSHDG